MSILDTCAFPIVAWWGPAYERITPRTMTDLGEAGFNISLSMIKSRDQMLHALDYAREAGVQLIINRPEELSVAAWVAAVQDHPGLFGYYIADEPKIARFDTVSAEAREVVALDPDHLMYVNHWGVNQTFAGARSYEDLWERFMAQVPAMFISADLYPLRAVSEDDWRQHQGDPHYFPRDRARFHEHFFEMLDLTRTFGFRWRLPMWAFTLSRSNYKASAAEGEMAMQLFCGLAYGAKGLQYFSYEHGNMLMEEDMSPAPNWYLARKLNRIIRVWESALKRLRSIGVYHHQPNLYYTRPLDQFFLGASTDLCLRGDNVVVGHFVDDTDVQEYALVVNRNPYEPAVIEFHFGTDGTVEELHPVTGAWQRPWPYNPRAMKLTFEPGYGRLFRFTRDIQPG